MGKIRHQIYFFIALFFITKTHSFGQEMTVSAKIDTANYKITTFVSLMQIPAGGRARFQQRLYPNAKVINLPSEFLLWDTAKNILTLIAANYPRVDTLSFQFVCKTDVLPDTLVWGEAALMYENNKGMVQKINVSAKKYVMRQRNAEMDSLVKKEYYIQISASKAMQNKQELAQLVRLQSEHSIIEEKTEKYYKYLIGNFATEEQAKKQLNYYKKYIPDAFVVRILSKP